MAKKYDIEINSSSGDEMSTFPIEEARLRSSWFPALISIVAAVGYGWALQATTVRLLLLDRASKEQH